jgi:hypothetical protein
MTQDAIPNPAPDTVTSVPSKSVPATDKVTWLGGYFSRRLGQLRRWREDLASAIAAYQDWVEQQGLTDGEEDLRVYELISTLQSDKLTIALAAEFSRGKSELLNAIFFADFKERLLPVGTGRTTMCPTELRFDEKDQPYVRLLPIETRKTAISISEYKRTPIHWTTIHLLKPDSVEEVRTAFQEVTRTKRVHVREAQELGLYDPSKTRRADDPIPVNDMIDIPVWRHAVINYPHPLLRQGLVILDTPGLNAIGVEPELTINMLPDAQALLFVLSADTGVTRTDLEVWTHCTRGSKRGYHLVALNKVDVLWDELQDEGAVAANITRQITETARVLNIDKSQIFPMSAQKGLLGKIRGDATLIERSGLSAIERKLAEDVIPARHSILRDRIAQEVGGRIEASRALLDARHSETVAQIAELKDLGGKNLDAIQKMVAHVRDEKRKYDKELEGFNITRTALTEQASHLLTHMSLNSVDKLISETRKTMEGSWTTSGLRNGMISFFSGASTRLDRVAREAEQIRQTVVRMYQRLHTEYGLPPISPPTLSVSIFLEQFRDLQEQAELFRTSPVTLMTEQHFVVKKFFITLVSRARLIFHEANDASKAWYRSAVSPVFVQIQQHKAAIEQKLESLRKIQQDMDTLGHRIAELEETRKQLEAQQQIAETLLNRIHQPLP